MDRHRIDLEGTESLRIFDEDAELSSLAVDDARLSMKKCDARHCASEMSERTTKANPRDFVGEGAS